MTGVSVVCAGAAELDSCGTLDSVAEEPASLPEELDPEEEEPDSLFDEPDPEEEADSLPDEPDPEDEPDSLLEEPDPDAEELDSSEELASEPFDSCAPVAGEDCCAEDPSVAEEDPSLDRGACAGALSVEVPVEVPLPVCVPGAAAERCASREAVARVALSVLPGKALAATAVSTPVSVALPAISQRLARLSRRRAASREREVWLGLTDIDCGAESRCTGGS